MKIFKRIIGIALIIIAALIVILLLDYARLNIRYFATKKNYEVPYYKFSNKNLIKTYKLPSMAEGMFYYDGYAYIMFENSSSKYFFAEPKINNVLKYKIS